MGLSRAFKKVTKTFKKVAGVATGFSPMFALPAQAGLFGKTAQQAGTIFNTGAASLAGMQFFGGGGGAGVEAAVPNSSWVNTALDLYAKDRDAKRAQSEASAAREFQDRSELRNLQFALARESMAAFGGQAGNNFNPPPGGFSNRPGTDNADNKRRFMTDGQDFMLPLVLAVGAIGLIFALKK